MSVDAGSPLAREWAAEEVKKLQRLDLAELEADERAKACAACKLITVGYCQGRKCPHF